MLWLVVKQDQKKRGCAVSLSGFLSTLNCPLFCDAEDADGLAVKVGNGLILCWGGDACS